MLRTRSCTMAASSVLALAGMLALAGCSGDSSGATPPAGSTCTLSSDCQNPLVCTAGRCHAQCAESRDCDYGQRCVKLGTTFLCQLQSEAKCVYNSDCTSPLICAVDLQCRQQCQADRDCAKGQVCTPTTKVCAEQTEVNAGGDITPAASSPAVDGSPAGGSLDASADVPQTLDVALPGDPVGQSDGGASLGDGGGSAGLDGSSKSDGRVGDTLGSSNPSPQTQFGFTVQGDSNPSFFSGIGVRAPNQLLIFNGYFGSEPTVSSDAGAPTRANYVYVQAFDPISGDSKGPAVPFFNAKNYDPSNAQSQVIGLGAAAVAPTGEIILLYDAGGFGLNAAFLGSSASDAGVSGLQLNKIVQVEVSQIAHQPNCIWSNAIAAFACSWHYLLSNTQRVVRVRKFLPDGRPAGGDSDQVPTDSSDNSTRYSDSVGLGISGSRFGVGYYSNVDYKPRLSVLDTKGSLIGSPVSLAASPHDNDWIAVAGTSAGLLAFLDDAGTAAVLVPVASDGSVPVTSNADAGALPGFRFPGTKSAVSGRALNDDVGGVGGVGLALLYNDGASFAYVLADGSTHLGPGSVISHAYTSGDTIEITNFGGSFGVSLYSAQSHSTQMAATSYSQ
jgi:hypothetical protein